MSTLPPGPADRAARLDMLANSETDLLIALDDEAHIVAASAARVERLRAALRGVRLAQRQLEGPTA